MYQTEGKIRQASSDKVAMEVQKQVINDRFGDENTLFRNHRNEKVIGGYIQFEIILLFLGFPHFGQQVLMMCNMVCNAPAARFCSSTLILHQLSRLPVHHISPQLQVVESWHKISGEAYHIERYGIPRNFTYSMILFTTIQTQTQNFFEISCYIAHSHIHN